MDNQVIMEALTQSTINVFIFGVLIGALFSIATLAIFDAIKVMRANCPSTCSMEMAKPAAKKAPAKAAAKTVAKKTAAKKKK